MYPVYAISGHLGRQLMLHLSSYSGNMTAVPYGHDISELPGSDPRAYVRLYTEIDTTNLSTLPSIWKMILVVLAVLLSILMLTSGYMHLTQRRRRRDLRLRVESGEVNLEALGIERFTIPRDILDLLPIFVYSDEISDQPGVSPPTILMGTEAEAPVASVTSHALKTEAKQSGHLRAAEFTIEIPQETVTITNPADPDTALPHKFLPYAQPVCPICLDDYVPGATEIKELPCGHIYHPECVDAFLSMKSSLCPLCKQCALPPGVCPVRISNAMVRKERNLRRLRQPQSEHDTWTRMKNIGSRFNSRMDTIPQELPTLGQPILSPESRLHPDQLRRPSLMNWPTSSPRGRQEFVAERIQELAARQAPIEDPDSQSRRVRSPWRTNMSRVLPGFR